MKRLLACLLAVLMPAAALAQGPACSSGQRFAAAQAEIDEALVAIGQGQPLSKLEARLTALGWPKDRQEASLRKVFASEALVALQREKQGHVTALMDAVVSGSGPEPRVSKCEAARKVKSLAAKIMSVDKRQYDAGLRELGLLQRSAS